VGLLVRSWNVFHGNLAPPNRRSHLQEMVRLASADEPDVLCLQEVPLWALPRLEAWSGGMTACWSVTRRSWVPARVGGWVTRRHQGLLRSAVSGQANAILLRPGLAVEDHREMQISEGGRERRTCHAVRSTGVVVGNLHASGEQRRPEVATAEIRRGEELVESMARNGEVCVLAGDFNLRAEHLPHLAGWSELGPGIDHVLVRGATATPLAVWQEQRRAYGGRLLSDHPPVETTVG
jgi:endonuclease/exonuclease/phosphatase family metal-dependent hydrolase